MEDESEFLMNGEWMPLSKTPRDLLEQWFLDLSQKSQEIYRRLSLLKAMLD